MRNVMLGSVGLMLNLLGGCEAIEPDTEVTASVPASLEQREPVREDFELASAPSMTGRITIASDELIAAPWAEIVVQPRAADEVGDAPPQQGFRHAVVEAQADASGYFSVPALAEGVTAADLSVYIDGELAHSETFTLTHGRVAKSIAVAVALGAWGLCVGSSWGSAFVQLKDNPNDKLKHCVASCRTQRYCGGSLVAGTLKEILDTVCKQGPQWLKDLLAKTGVSGCGGWDNADMAANAQGLSCAYKWKTCMSCCDGYY